jgi:3-dehydroquinate synthase
MRHGEAVALDMLVSTGIAVRRGLCSKGLFARMLRLYGNLGLPRDSPLLQARILLRSARDACCHRSGKLNLVVPLDLGRAAYLQDLKPEDLEGALAMMEHARR